MSVKIGYLLPTRERIMDDEPSTARLIELAEKAETLGYDSLWVGDSLFARPRHEPMTLLAGVATRTQRVELGTAVLLPALRNPVLLAHQAATLDQLCQGRLILGLGIAGDVPNIRAEFEAAGVPFEKRVGRLLEGVKLCRALWSGEEVNWDGLWSVKGATLGPTPARPGGPLLWSGGHVPGAIKRAGRYFDGWFPTGPDDASEWGSLFREIQSVAKDSGRDPAAVTGAVYLTVALDDNAEAANARIDSYLEGYYSAPAAVIRKRQACYGGTAEGLAEWLQSFIDAGAQHLMLRFAGDHDHQLDAVSKLRAQQPW